MRTPPADSNPSPTRAAAAPLAQSGLPVWLMAVMLGLVTIALYWPATRCDFVNYDDPAFVTANAQVQGGLSWEGLKWAFLNPVCCIWHPLTVLSHMLVCQFVGLKPWGHHLANVLLHAVNAMLVFVLLQQMTGARWRSLVVAALFAFHPLRVESVAWVAERKDVLSGFFGLLALCSYARYAEAQTRKAEDGVQKPEARGSWSECQPRSSSCYLLSLCCFGLGLLSKPMLVTWPFVMLLLDYWPLARFQPGRTWQVVREKIPFLALAAATSTVTFMVQKHEGALAAGEHLTLGARSANALVSYDRYLGKLFWPMDLAVFYPHPGNWPLEQVLLAGGVILGISVLFFAQRRRCPFLLMGWLWFVGMLVPVIGLVQSGAIAMADRYTYLPCLGVLILTAWGAFGLVERWRYGVIGCSVAASVAIALCMALTRQQLRYWQDGEALFRHSLQVTENNYVAHTILGDAFVQKGRTDEAIAEYQQAVRLRPDDALAHYCLGVALETKGQTDEAISQFQQAIRLEPSYADSHGNLGTALAQKGQVKEAISQFRQAINLKPNCAEAHYNLGLALVRQGQSGEAIRHYREALRLKSNYAMAHYNLATALAENGDLDEAIRHYQEALRLKPDAPDAHFSLGIALVKQGQIDEAISQYQQTLRLQPDNADAHYNLGVILARKGQTDQAISHYQEALRLKPDYALAHNNLGIALGRKGQLDDAIGHFQEALRLQPAYAEACNNLAYTFLRQGQLDQAITQYQEALRLTPENGLAHNNLGLALQRQGRLEEAIHQFQEALRLVPDYADARKNLDVVLGAKADPPRQPGASTKP